MNNIILKVDSYKASHWVQYPPNTTKVYSYLESRGGKYGHTVFFGLQILLEQLEKPVTVEMVEEAKAFYEAHGEPFNYEGWMYIAKDLDGKLPVRIKAVPEGLVVPTHNVLMTVENTDPKCFWLTSWLETFLMRVWYPITVSTQSWHIKQVIREHLNATADDPAVELPFKLHDFGSRGVSSSESAAIGGAAHLVNFMGSDTVEGVYLMNKVYNEGKMSAFSIPAAEHSTITTWGKDGELEAYRNMLKQYAKPGSIVAVVSDSYDLDNAVENMWGGALKEEVLMSGATIVIRPDSGHPPTVVLNTLRRLEKAFGAQINSKGYKVLHNVRVIQGDGINEESIREILNTIRMDGFSASNVAFGMGGALLQQVNRDTQRFAYKCSSAVVGEKEIDVFKDPKTDPGKRSKKGRLDLVHRLGKYETIQGDSNWGSVLKTVYENGKVLVRYKLDEIRRHSSK